MIKDVNITRNLKHDYVISYHDAWVESNYLLDINDKTVDHNEISHDNNLFSPLNRYLLHIQMDICYKPLGYIIQRLNEEIQAMNFKMIKKLEYCIASEIFKEILLGVNYLHNQKIIHRDLKPDNILFTLRNNGKFIKIADMGFATIHDYDGQEHSGMTGTSKYMAPEVRMFLQYNTKADIFSLGLITVELFKVDISRYEHEYLRFFYKAF